MILYAIRHKATGQLMPQGKKDRGYSHWNPNNTTGHLGHGMQQALPVPRLIDTRGRAARCINMWANYPNAKQSFGIGEYGYGAEPDGIDVKDDGRKKEDLEVVEISLEIRNETTSS